MLPNLNAEQARYGHSNQYVADALHLNRNTYEGKKKSGRFSLEEINMLCDIYKCDYSYLFCQSPIIPGQLKTSFGGSHE
jgi:hypothetical protein|nr:hypothetical protein [uncultured Schaedlerella sp.]